MLIVVTAPSGAGKTTIVKELMNRINDLKFSVSATTRHKRNGEIDGKDYYFISKDEFEQKVKQGEFVEYEEVHGNYYGTLKKEIEKFINLGKDVIFDVDVKGALSIKKTFSEALTFFIYAPEDVIISRLKNRKTESEQQIKKRIERMKYELNLKDKFDYGISNLEGLNGLNNAVNEIIKIINNNKKRRNNAN
jgi:guanylate kinase